jgi:hexulose-6-phosphate isomerase
MKNTLQMNYWTIGGFEGGKPPVEALEDAKKMGLDGVELCFDGKEFGPGISEKRCREIRKAARELDMTIESLASGFYWGASLGSTRKGERQKAVTYTKEYLQVARWVGAKVVLVVPGAVAVPWDESRPVVPYQDVWTHSTASIRQCLPVAKKLGVTMGIENVWNWFLADPVAMKTYVDQFKSSRVKCYLDVANCAINGFAEHWIEILGKRRLGAVHVKNFSRDDCGGTLHGFGDDLLKGDVDMVAVRKALKRVGYAGPITAEMIPFSRLPDLVLPDMKMARDTAKKMKKVFG